MAQVHSKGIIYHDLSLENIFLNDYLLSNLNNFYTFHFLNKKDERVSYQKFDNLFIYELLRKCNKIQ